MACSDGNLLLMVTVCTWILLVSSWILLRGTAATSFCEQVVQPLGYACTEYTVQTEDGFVLVMHRLGHMDWPTLTGETDDTRIETEKNYTSSIGPQTAPQPSSRTSKSTSTPGFSKLGGEERALFEFPSPFSSRNSDFKEADRKKTRQGRVSRSTIASTSTTTSPALSRRSSGQHSTMTSESSAAVQPLGDPYNSSSGVEGARGASYNSSRVQPPLIPSIGNSSRHPVNISATMPPVNTSSAQSAPLSSNRSPSESPRPSEASVEPAASPSNRSSPGLQPSQMNSTSSTQPTAPGPTGRVQPNINSAIPASAPSANLNMTSRNFTAHPSAGKGAPVLLMHQEFLNGDSWFQYVDDQHTGLLLPSMLFEDGFDVWVGHQRATYWGHDHVQLHFTDRDRARDIQKRMGTRICVLRSLFPGASIHEEYWNWTWDQHAQYDLPAQLRFINEETNQTVHYIGASQAATVGAAGATYPGTVSMLRSLTLIGPTIYRGNTNSLLLDAWAYFFGLSLDSEFYASGFQNGAFNYSSEFATGPIYGTGPTALAIGLISGPNCCLGSAVISFDNGWDGTTSFKNLLHWQQGIRKNTWQHYDYSNGESNYVAYGQPTSPYYNPALIPETLPVLVIAGDKDWTAPRQGINVFWTQLQKSATLVNLSNYAHYDLTYSATRENDVYVPILQFLEGPTFA